MDDREVDAFFERLGGQAPGPAAPPGLLRVAEELRAELLQRSALPAHADALTEDERADRDALFSRLAARGAFAVASGSPDARSTGDSRADSPADTTPAWAAPPGASGESFERGQRPRRPGLSDWLRAWLNRPWQRALAFASILVLGTGVAVKLMLEPPADESVVRGGGDLVLRVDQPRVFAEQLQAQLTSDGALVVLADLGGNRWALSIAVPTDAARIEVAKRLQSIGVKVPGEAEWLLRIDPR